MFDKVKTLNKWRKAQSEIEKQMEQVTVSNEKGVYHVVVNANNKIVLVEEEGEENKLLKDLLNNSLKEAKKKAEKKLKGQVNDLGLSDLL